MFLQKHYKIGVSANFGHFFDLGGGVPKAGSNKWSTPRSISGPHFGSIF